MTEQDPNPNHPDQTPEIKQEAPIEKIEDPRGPISQSIIPQNDLQTDSDTSQTSKTNSSKDPKNPKNQKNTDNH